jgi:WD40 repeat protein
MAFFKHTPPKAFICPLSQQIMENPVIAADGYSYEKTSIEDYLRKNEMLVSPITGKQLTHCYTEPNHTLQKAIQEWKQDDNRQLGHMIQETVDTTMSCVHEQLLFAKLVKQIMTEFEQNTPDMQKQIPAYIREITSCFMQQNASKMLLQVSMLKDQFTRSTQPAPENQVGVESVGVAYGYGEEKLDQEPDIHPEPFTNKGILTGHEKFVNTIAVLPSGLLASGSTDQQVSFWDLKKQERLRTLPEFKKWITSICAGPTGNTVFVAQSNYIQLWDGYTRQKLHDFTMDGKTKAHDSIVYNLATMSADNFVSGGGDGYVKMCDVPSGQLVSTEHSHKGKVFNLATLGVKTVFSSSNQIMLWDVSANRCTNITSKMPNDDYYSLALSKIDEHVLVSCNKQNDVLQQAKRCLAVRPAQE